tara:strand:+ start:1110 stop:1358 length:249 start_codon:yes stop_codon:yes gene_type:complete
MFKPGDLVRYTERRKVPPPHILPHGVRPVGVVISVEERLIESNTGPDAIMRVIRVKWGKPDWNTTGGLSEECSTDLELIQSI